VSYWAVPAGSRTARDGRWKRGPGGAVFDAMGRELGVDGQLPLVAEDLGVITPAVRRLRDELGFPGMVVLQFAFDPGDPHGPHRFENHVENRVIYTATHDHDTIRGWYESLDPESREAAEAEATERGIAWDRRRPWWPLIRLALSSRARLAMVQAQDVLGLGSEARMNYPSRATGNWRWQLRSGALTPTLARRLREATEEAGRLRP
jgi:4-alpha-glucanotransferase